MKIDTRQILDRLKDKGTRGRGRVNIYVDTATFKKFQATCEKEGLSASRVLEELMKEVSAATKSPESRAGVVRGELETAETEIDKESALEPTKKKKA